MKLKNKKFIITSLTIIALLAITVIQIGKNSGNQEETRLTSSQGLSNKKIGWGIKRNDNHEQPDLGKVNKEILEKNNGIAMGNNNDKYIYLTFDEGYEAGHTTQILSTLKENNVKVTFFITAHYLNTQPDLVKQMIEEGHIVGNHTVNHKSMPSLTEEQLKEELMNLHTAVYDKFNYEMHYMRPPKGEYSERVLSQTVRLGYIPVMWSFAYADWDEKAQPSNEEGTNKIINNLHNGEIMLLHATSKTNMEILDTVIKQIKEMGYEIKSIDDFAK